MDLGEAQGQLNQLKQLIDRIKMDTFRTEEELKSRTQRSMAEDSDDSDALIVDAPPDPEDAQIQRMQRCESLSAAR